MVLKRLLYRLFFLILIIFTSPTCSEAITYVKFETDHFIVQYHEGDAKLSQYIAEESETIRVKIISDVGYNFSEKTRIILAPSIEEFQQVQPRNEKIPLWAAAVAYPEHNLIIIRSPRAVKEGHLDYRSVFIHEFTHIVLGRALQQREVPRWLAEGFAMYESSEWHLSRMAILTNAALTDRMIPLRKLTDNFPSDYDGAELAYAESFMFVSFLINNFGEASFHQFIKNFNDSGDLRGSLQHATGMHLVNLEQEWVDYIKMRVSWIPLITSATTLWFLLTLVLIYGYYNKKMLTQKTLTKWEDEESSEERISMDRGKPSRQNLNIAVVLFDFGGVIAEEGFKQGLLAIANSNSLEGESFIKKAYDSIYSTGYILGKAPESAFWRALRQETGIEGGDQHLRNEIFSRFIIRDWMIALIKKVKDNNIQVGILSDQTDMLDELNDKYDFFRLFDYVFNSYHIGKSKRDPSHFDDVANVLGVSPDRILFVDDDPGNCERARQRGFNALHFIDRDSFLSDLQKILPLQ